MDQLKQRIINMASDTELIEMVRQLVEIPSDFSCPEREEPVAKLMQKMLQYEGIDTQLQYVYPGRPNVIASLQGVGGGKSLTLNGHVDTVPSPGMKEPFGLIKDGKMYGRGTCDMKGGCGCMMYALMLLKRAEVTLRGDLYYTGVIDEDAAGSAGTRYVVKNGPVSDFAIVGEPTNLYPVVAHKGVDYFQIDFEGKSAHSSTPENGVSAVYAAGEYVYRLEQEMIPRYNELVHPLVGHPTINAALIEGCAKMNKAYLRGESAIYSATIPDDCTVYLDVRWTPYMKLSDVENDLRELAYDVCSRRPGMTSKVSYIPLPRPAMEISVDSPLVKSIIENQQTVMGYINPTVGAQYFGDTGILYSEGGIQSILFGPGDISCAHSDLEWIELEDLKKAAVIYALTAIDVCGVAETE